MVKNHLKTITIPRTWSGVLRKAQTYIIKPDPGPHTREHSMPLQLLLQQLGHAKTAREVRALLHHNTVLVDGRRIKSPKFPVGLMDRISLPKTKEHYIMTLNNKGKLTLEARKKSEQKTSKILKKTTIKKGKTQLNLSDGKNIITSEHKHKPGDSIIIEVPSQKIIKALPLAKGTTILLTGGKHRGEKGTIKTIEGKDITYTNDTGKEIKTLKNYAYAIEKQ